MATKGRRGLTNRERSPRDPASLAAVIYPIPSRIIHRCLYCTSILATAQKLHEAVVDGGGGEVSGNLNS